MSKVNELFSSSHHHYVKMAITEYTCYIYLLRERSLILNILIKGVFINIEYNY